MPFQGPGAQEKARDLHSSPAAPRAALAWHSHEIPALNFCLSGAGLRVARGDGSSPSLPACRAPAFTPFACSSEDLLPPPPPQSSLGCRDRPGLDVVGCPSAPHPRAQRTPFLPLLSSKASRAEDRDTGPGALSPPPPLFIY